MNEVATDMNTPDPVNTLEHSNEEYETDNNNEVEIDDDIIQVVSFSLRNRVQYGIDILFIHEILRRSEMTRLPNTPPFIKGVLNLRGNVIPVVNVRKRFGLKESKITDNTRIIVVGINEKLVGLLVDEVYQVIRIPLSNIDSPTNLIEGVSAEFISGVGRLKDRLIILLNLEHMLFPFEDE